MNKKISIPILVLFIISVITLIYVKQSQASPSQIVDGTAATGTSYSSHRRVVRTTSGTNSNRVFASVNEGTDVIIYYSDDPEASSPTWTPLTLKTGVTYRVTDMVWDESNNVIYVCYARGTLANNNNADVFYKRLSNLGGSPPTLGAEQTVFNGSSGGTTYNGCNIEIAGDSGTTKVFVFANSGASGGNIAQINVRAGTIDSDSPTWTTSYAVKSWTATADSGSYGVGRVNTDKLVLFYHNATDFLATRHDDSASAGASSGWDALDGTDNSQTTISSDDPPTSAIAEGSIVGALNSNLIWFAWLDSAQDVNTIRWNGSSLDTEMVPEAAASSSIGPALATDGAIVYLVYRNQGTPTQSVFQTRIITDGTTAWSGTENIFDTGSENEQHQNISKKIYQGHLDLITTSSTSSLVRHASTYKVSGNAYTESASSTYEGSTVWSGCDSSTLNVAISVAGTKYNTWCNSSTGEFNFVLPKPSGADIDITVYLDTAGGDKGAIFTHNNDTLADISSLKLYKSKVWIESQSSTSITNADINSYDQSNDADIPVASDGTVATFDSGTELHINTGDTYAPGGNVTAPKMHIMGTYTGASETLTLNGSGSSSSCDDTITNLRPLCIDGGTFTPSSNTTLFSGSSASLIQNTTYNTLRIEPGGNSITHTLMAGATSSNGSITLGNGTNTSVTITAATNSTTLTSNANLTISANTTFIANGSNTTTVKGNWTNSGSFTHSSGTVSLLGADSSTQILTGNNTFNNLSASTSTNSAGRTIQFIGLSSNTVSGTWTVTGFSGKVITLQSSNSNSWTINPSAASVDYVSVSRSTNTGTSFCATHSADGGNNSGWNITAAASCNQAPNAPALNSPSNGAVNQSINPVLQTTTTDPDSDYLRYKIELCENIGMSTNCQTFNQVSSQTGWSGQNTQTSTAYTSGTQATYTVQTPLSNSMTYYWRSYAIDPAGVNTFSSTQTPRSFTTISLGADDFSFKGLNFKGINLQ